MLEAKIRTVANKRRVEQCFKNQVHPRAFTVRDLVLNVIGMTTWDKGKLEPRWEGPYVVTATNRLGSYRLKDFQGDVLTHPWKAKHLRKNYC